MSAIALPRPLIAQARDLLDRGQVEPALATARRRLGHLDLPFEPACLRFHENRRYAPTPSYA
ncbi:hypothetical protein ACN2C7_17950 [Caulobacter sp. ErkDOM-E]|uniref:hypothetical protein n=1 Tax=Caulobacter sp. ErkDOM-E TaxID=3402778 RepID=UPI003AF7476B